MRNEKYAFYVILLASLGLAVLAYPHLPEQVVSHWGMNNEPNGYSGRLFMSMLAPCVIIAMYIMRIIVLKIDPLAKNIHDFDRSYELIWLTMILFMFYIQILTTVWNIGHEFPMGQYMAPGLAFIWFIVGAAMKDSKRNWSVGIKTAWTLSSDEIWRKTHLLASRLFKISGVLALVPIVYPAGALYFAVAPVITSSIVAVVYSYVLYAKQQKAENAHK